MLAVSFTDARTKPVLVTRPSDYGQIKLSFSTTEKYIDESGVVLSRTKVSETDNPYSSINFRNFMLEQLLVVGIDSLKPSTVSLSRIDSADKVDSILNSINS